MEDSVETLRPQRTMTGVDDELSVSCGSCVSDAETTSTADSCGTWFGWMGLKKLVEEDEENIFLKHRFYSNLGSISKHCPVVAVHKNMHNVGSGKARLEAFQHCAEATKEKRGGNANIRNAWFGASKEGIDRIVQHGFELTGQSKDRKTFGLGLQLCSDGSAIDSVVSSVPDENGLRHLVVCCVIMGNTEEITPHSIQTCPSNNFYDSGVDNKIFPKKYIIWPSQVKTHVLPLYVLSIKLEIQRKEAQSEPVRKPTSPWIPFTTLVCMLSSRLPAREVCKIRRLHNAYMERKITRQQLVFQVRQLSGDKLLVSAIKAFRTRQAKIGSNSPLKR